MNIAIPLGGQIRMVICSSFVIAKRKDTTHYDLSGESFQLTGVTADQVYVFDDSVVITEGMELIRSLDGVEAVFVTSDYELHVSSDSLPISQ